MVCLGEHVWRNENVTVNPPSFEKFDGGASSRWPVTREIESYWYPVWLTFPTGMLPGARLLDASPAKITKAQTVEIARDYEFLVVFTSTVGFQSDVQLIRQMKEKNPGLKIAFVGPHVQNRPDESLKTSADIDFIVRGEFDHAVVEFAQGKPLDQILGISYRKNGRVVHTGHRPQLHTEELGRAAVCRGRLQAKNLKIENYNVPFLLHPSISLYTTRGCPALCTFCQWPQTISGHAWRVRSTENVSAGKSSVAWNFFRRLKEFFFDDDTFNIRKDRVLELSAEIQAAEIPLVLQRARAQRLRDAQSHGRCRRPSFHCGFESGDRPRF